MLAQNLQLCNDRSVCHFNFFLFFCQCDCIHLLEKWNIKRVNIDKDEVWPWFFTEACSFATAFVTFRKLTLIKNVYRKVDKPLHVTNDRLMDQVASFSHKIYNEHQYYVAIKLVW